MMEGAITCPILTYMYTVPKFPKWIPIPPNLYYPFGEIDCQK